MKKIFRKYIPIIILIFLFILAWVEELIIDEGYFSEYLHLPEHKFLRFIIRGIFFLLIFIIGYIGISLLLVKWAKSLWLYWYAIAFFVGSLRVILDIIMGHYFNDNIVSIFMIFYYLNLTPLPYIVLLVLAMIVKRKQAGI
ncbi:hypothetical protein GALL_109340 [mine drainage metagenome]|uniref:Uncharacterized protein n=1 Tax=mine drainage metagenome TaxID=410659 RepID=A0A1J5SGJ3_9ZZZZ